MFHGLEREFFVDDQLYCLESQAIFAKNWICIARAEDFEVRESSTETFRTVQVGDFNVLVVRDQNGHYSAFHNLCRHRGTRLAEQECGAIRNSCVMCPYHAWTYDLSGKLIGAPNMKDVAEFDRANFGLKPVGCVNWCGFILIHLEATSDQFSLHFAPMFERMQNWRLQDLTLGHTLHYTVEANWKLIFQNYSECYHCPTVHPKLNQLTPYRTATNDITSGPILGGPMELVEGVETVSIDGRKISTPLSGLNDAQRRSVYYYTIFPTMFVSAHPDYVMVHQISRLSKSRTDVKCHFLVDAETSQQDWNRAVAQWDEVNSQDWHVCELTQKGIESPAYKPGPYSNLESMLIAFDKHYRTVMGECSM